MRVLDIRTGHEQDDILLGQGVLASELGHPSKNVMVIRGSSSEIAQFADRAAVRSNPFPFREVVWVRHDSILTQKQVGDWFAGHPGACAVVFDFEDKPLQWLKPEASLLDIEKAFLSAQTGGAA